jgi:NSS family neurotransmitter:Na+ symporter
MPFGSLCLALVVGYGMKVDWIQKECELEGNSFGGKGYWTFCYKFLSPVAMAFILLGQIDGFFGLGIFG